MIGATNIGTANIIKGIKMTATTARKSVLIVGKSRLVLDGTVSSLRALGYKATATSDFGDVARQFDLCNVDLVVFGGQVPTARKAELTREIRHMNPRAGFVDGLAGIPGLLVQQVEGAFAADDDKGCLRATYEPKARAIQLTLAREADVRLTAWWQTSFVPPDPKSDSLELLSARLAAGMHSIAVPDRIPDRAAFAVAEVGRARHMFAITAQ
jgi:hypothetical protein